MNQTISDRKSFLVDNKNEHIAIAKTDETPDATFKPDSETSSEDHEEYKRRFHVSDEIDDDFRQEAEDIKKMLATFNDNFLQVSPSPKNKNIHILEELEDITEEVIRAKKSNPDDDPKTLVDLIVQQSKSPYNKKN